MDHHDDNAFHHSDDHSMGHDTHHGDAFQHSDTTIDVHLHHDDHQGYHGGEGHHFSDLGQHHGDTPHFIYDHEHTSGLGGASLGTEETQYPHFNPVYTGPGIIGDPGHDMTHWHHQLYDNTCAVASQDFVLESFGIHISEDELRDEAMAHGWYTPHGGTPVDHVGDLLALHGIPVVRHDGATMTEMTERLSMGEKVIVGVNAEDIWYHGSPDDPLAHYPGIPGQQPDHAVEVIGVDNTDPAHPYVILNDPGSPDGQGIAIPEDVFENAWATSHNTIVATDPSGASSSVSTMQAGATLGGYSNADGTYHWDSDNTDRDPETDAIIRQW